MARGEGAAAVVIRFLAALAGALGRLLGLVRPLAVPSPPGARLVPLAAMASPWVPSRLLGLPGDCPPIERGAP